MSNVYHLSNCVQFNQNLVVFSHICVWNLGLSNLWKNFPWSLTITDFDFQKSIPQVFLGKVTLLSVSHSAVSDFLRPQGLQPARLFCP